MRMVFKALGIAMLVVPSLVQAQEEIDVQPDPEVIQGVESSKGGPPLLYRQIEEYSREYERYLTYAPKVNRKSKSETITMDNLVLPFEVEVSKGYITTLTFIDARGNPFPVRVSRVGNSNAFVVCTGTSEDCKITEADIDIAHILTIGTTYQAGRSNLRVFFNGLYKAVQIPLVVKKDSYHDEVTIMLPVDNPDFKAPSVVGTIGRSAPVDTDDYIARGMIDGISAEKLGNGIQLNVELENRIGSRMPNDGTTAIFSEGNTYLKTTIRSPNPEASAMTHGFMREVVYRFDGRPRAVSGFDRDGNVVVLRITAPDNVLGYRELKHDR